MDATSSRQAPDSPVSNTGKFVPATRSTCFIISMNVSLSDDFMFPLSIQILSISLEKTSTAQIQQGGRRPRPGRRPPFNARGVHPVYNARVSSKKIYQNSYAMRGKTFSINQQYQSKV